jgi:heme/copper-type cytochrome/quinol oxidase subunit 2
MTTEQPKKVINRYSLRIALVNMLIGIELFFMPFLLQLIQGVLPARSIIKQSGGGDVMFYIIPLSFLITLVGLIITIVALARRGQPVPQGAPLTGKNKTAIVFTAIFALLNLWITFMVSGLGW